MDNRLPPAAIGLRCLSDTNLGRFVLLVQHDRRNWNTGSNHDDGESSISPAKVEVVVEQFRDARACKGARNLWCAVDAEHDHSIFKRSHVGHHDVDDVQDPKMSGPVERVCGHISLNILSGGLHNQAYCKYNKHKNEALNTTPDIDDFGKREFGGASKNCRDDADACKKAVPMELRCDIGVEGGLERCYENVDEGDKVQSAS